MHELELGLTYRERLARTLPEVRGRIAEAARRAGRDPASVRLVAVTKGHPAEAIEAAVEAGLRDLGENRVEELESKVARFAGRGVTWHMIGHVQGRKAGRVLDAAEVIHSVDSLRLAERIDRLAGDRGWVARVLAQVNSSGEESKSGFDGGAAVEAVLSIAALPNLRVEGLMTMAPFVDDEQVLCAAFRRLRETRDEARRRDPRVGLELSMGMTNDLEIAIREGSTIVRIGTALFGERGGQ
jgi:pyridoxal phosphate enzyme (YggS family)